MKHPEILCVGELLVDLLSTEYAPDFRSADTYRRYAGGSPANLAMNLARLGQSVGLVATVGDDDAGELLREAVADTGCDVSLIATAPDPTTLILVTKSRQVSNFEAYRSADKYIAPEQFPEDYLAECRLFHTTAFALSRQPARGSIMAAAARVAAAGGRLSIDVNYAAKIWPNRLEALWVISKYIALGGEGAGTLVKCSEVDYERLFDEPVEEVAEAAGSILDLGAGVVCLTLGARGSYVVSEAGSFATPARPVEVVDTTGAGDAFWSGFLAGYVNKLDWEDCALRGRAMAEQKLTTDGPLTTAISLDELRPE
ncbi:carbohydrate kinase family protein [Lewinella sp. JB7]|uniref:carbohydrate kinase family protein n=1 Tax=Lewinella sp. JB7 TaxID=2962887 RepID=UPI0020C9530B|nr:sugar kinase [Lewinella sp. JB7]MCP9235091.1 sugar kinase [Lewinella sp. JB7]